MDNESPWWAPALGVGVLLMLLVSLGLVAAGGWNWFAGFLASSAPSWVQAIGSVAAILVAVWVAQGAERDAKRHAISNARTFAATATGTMEEMLKAVRQDDRENLPLMRSVLEVSVDHGRRVQVEHLPIDTIAAVVGLQALAAQAIEVTREAEAAHPGVVLFRAERVLAHCVAMGEKHCDAVAGRHPTDAS